jgi:hypothetical protein
MRTAPQGDLARGTLSVVHRSIGDFVRYARIPVRIRATSLGLWLVPRWASSAVQQGRGIG